jgi:ABC-type lipoprotein release transport system permease subunit
MAWRNVWRNRRRTIVTVAAMTLALLVMILYAALMEGYLRGMERNILDLEGPGRAARAARGVRLPRQRAAARLRARRGG